MKTKLTTVLALVCSLAVASAGCATMISGTNQSITINSTPPGAQVTLGYQTGTTPVTLHIPKGKDYIVEVSQGPDHRMVPLNRNVDAYTFLNIIPPLWPGFIVDAVTGAITKYEPEVINVDFRTAAYTSDAKLVKSGQ